MHNDFGNEGQNEIFAEGDRELEADPVVSVFQGLKAVALEVHLAVEVLFVERLHWDLALSMIFGLIGLVLEGEVVLDRAARILDFLILSRAHHGRAYPEGGENGNRGEQAEENGSLATTTDLP